MQEEEAARQAGCTTICGIDEAGRGPLAGPVVAAAVILPPGYELPGLNDSKKLTARKRESLYAALMADDRVLKCIAHATVEEIDERNILRDFALCLGLTLSIEVFQLFTMLGGFATADLIMNALGYFVGLLIYYLIFKKRTLKTCIWTCRIANFIFFVLFVYAFGTSLQNGKLIFAILTRTL
jgi:hypothetical protein